MKKEDVPYVSLFNSKILELKKDIFYLKTIYKKDNFSQKNHHLRLNVIVVDF